MEEINTGLPVVGGVSWGTHFCQFYGGREDLADSLASYFKIGLEGNEYCLWITAEPLGVEDATSVLRVAVGDLDGKLKRKQIEIIDHRDWYMGGGPQRRGCDRCVACPRSRRIEPRLSRLTARR